ncbi:rnhA operon protein [Haloarcula sp. S1CR25-12]|uniref:RnhA operon protein n=1 Tax=Haloarcula saliterrae TaxID=2950534 RepID=A0ABU2F8G9_9EURY|nr:rnhA operon protein [Haloarcula sp. S1CR25-12]MDS0258021.1 rnhA operon protein [Haloarcula sp. S1CR25-12]
MPDLPTDTVDEVERLTRLAREAVDEGAAAAYREQRDSLLDDHGYEARIREEDTGDVLVCYPSEWVDDGVIRPDRVEDTDRGVEVRLSGPGDPEKWEDVEARNRAVVAAVRDEHGEVHAATARSLADFMGNHYAKPIAEATPDELAEFREEYFRRNAWPTDRQRALLDDSVRLTVKKAETSR